MKIDAEMQIHTKEERLMTFSADSDLADPTSDLHIVETRPLLPPASLHRDLPLDLKSAEIVSKTRKRIQSILSGADSRLLVIVGPCSVHDVNAAKEYASFLKSLRDRFSQKLEIVMRVYFEKPRTTVGWK